MLKFIGSSGRLGGAKRFSDSIERLGQRPIRYEEKTSVGMAPPGGHVFNHRVAAQPAAVFMQRL
jgi:hypothetical protein